MASAKEIELAQKLIDILKKQQPEWLISGSSIIGKFDGKTVKVTNQTRTIREPVIWKR